MRDPAVVTDKYPAVLQPIRQRRERQVPRHADPIVRQKALQLGQALFIRFASNEQELPLFTLLQERRQVIGGARIGGARLRRARVDRAAIPAHPPARQSLAPPSQPTLERSTFLQQRFRQRDETLQRPAFLLAPAPGMNRAAGRINHPRFVRHDPPRRIVEIQGERLERTRQLPGGVFLVVHPARAREEVAHPGPLQVGGKNLIRIEEITDDLLKAAEVVDQL